MLENDIMTVLKSAYDYSRLKSAGRTITLAISKN